MQGKIIEITKSLLKTELYTTSDCKIPNGIVITDGQEAPASGSNEQSFRILEVDYKGNKRYHPIGSALQGKIECQRWHHPAYVISFKADIEEYYFRVSEISSL